MVHHDIKIFIKESTATSPMEERQQLWQRRSNNINVKEITLLMEETASIERTSTILDKEIPDGVDQGCDYSRSGIGVVARVKLQLRATHWIFSGFHLHETILYVSR